MAMLEVKGIRKTFGGQDVLKGIDFSLERGQVLAIIGASGSGKTTLLRCINQLEQATEGTVWVDGRVVLDANHPVAQTERERRENRLRLGFVFQAFHLFPQYTALQNVMLAPQLQAKQQPDYKKHKAERLEQLRREAQALLEQVGLGDRANCYPHQLSGGQQQRVAIARALAMKPDILCFDEPTSALDPELTGEVLKVIRALAEKQTTMVIVTHEMAFARDVADRVLFLDAGSVVEQGTPDAVLNHPKELRTRQFLARFRPEESKPSAEGMENWAF